MLQVTASSPDVVAPSCVCVWVATTITEHARAGGQQQGNPDGSPHAELPLRRASNAAHTVEPHVEHDPTKATPGLPDGARR